MIPTRADTVAPEIMDAAAGSTRTEISMSGELEEMCAFTVVRQIGGVVAT
jgi:endoglucanase Acf2